MTRSSGLWRYWPERRQEGLHEAQCRGAVLSGAVRGARCPRRGAKGVVQEAQC